MRLRTNAAIIFLILSVLSLTGCLSTPDRVTKARMEVNPAPEMRGAGYDMKVAHEFRFSGNVNYGPSDGAQVGGIYNEWPSGCGSSACQEAIEKVAPSSKVNLKYDIEYAILTGSAEFLLKKGLFLMDVGIGINNGLYDFLSLGLHTSHFEMGVSGGFWLNMRKYEYEGYMYTHDLLIFNERVEPVSKETDKTFAYLLGIYMGVYFGDFGFEVSSSVYNVNLEYEHFSSEPYISTTYTTANYRLTDRWTVRAGAVLLQGSGMKSMFVSGLAGVSYSL